MLRNKSYLYYGINLLIALLYVLSGLLSFALMQTHKIVTVSIFLPEGIALAAAIIYGRNILPGIFGGQLILALASHLPFFAAIGIAAVNTIEALIAIELFKYLKLSRHLEHLRDLFGILAMSAFVLQPFSAFFGNTILYLFDVQTTASFWHNMLYWWFGNTMGQIVLTPFLLILYGRYKNISLPKVLLTILLFGLLHFVLQVILNVNNISVLLAATLPLTIYLATRDLFYASLATVTLAIVSITLVALDSGIFAHSKSGIDNILDLNFYILSQIILVLMVGILFREKKSAMEKLKAMAHFDYLTGLPNRHLLREKIHRSLYLAHKLHCNNAICFIDLDGFKAVNDKHGHHIGDQLLKEVAYLLRSHTYNDDVLLRLGGDEFLLIFNDIDKEKLEEKLRLILKEINDIEVIDGCNVEVGLSIGVAWCPLHGEDVKSLMEAADSAMYRAKKEGKNRYLFAPLPKANATEQYASTAKVEAHTVTQAAL